MAGAEAEGRRESEAEAEDEWASEAEGVPLTRSSLGRFSIHMLPAVVLQVISLVASYY